MSRCFLQRGGASEFEDDERIEIADASGRTLANDQFADAVKVVG